MTSSLNDLYKSFFSDLAMRRYTQQVTGNLATLPLVLTRIFSVPAEEHASPFNSMALQYYTPAARIVFSYIQTSSI
jgi:hypothetical protein